MIVEITTDKPINIKRGKGLSLSQQIQSALATEPHTIESLKSGIHDVTPSRRPAASFITRISGWKVEVADSQGELYTAYAPMGALRGGFGKLIFPPTVTVLEPGVYYAVGDSFFGRIRTNRFVANLSETPMGEPLTPER